MRIRTAIYEIFAEMVKQLSNEFKDTMTTIKICAKALNKIMQTVDLYEYQIASQYKIAEALYSIKVWPKCKKVLKDMLKEERKHGKRN